MTAVYVLFEEQEMKGIFTSLEKALLQREKLENRGLIAHCKLDAFIHNPLSLDTNLLYPGVEPILKEGFNRENTDMKALHPKMQEELETLFRSWEQ